MIKRKKKRRRDVKDDLFAYAHHVVCDEYGSKIGAVGLALYLMLARYANKKQCAWPSQETLAEKLGISKQTVIKYLKILKDEGLIRIRKCRDTTNRYYLLRVKKGSQAR